MSRQYMRVHDGKFTLGILDEADIKFNTTYDDITTAGDIIVPILESIDLTADVLRVPSNAELQAYLKSADDIESPLYLSSLLSSDEDISLLVDISTMQFSPYNASRTYYTGETCTVWESGKLVIYQMYAGPNMSCVGKSPLDESNRHGGWTSTTEPFYWIPYSGNDIGRPFWWLSTTAPEYGVFELGTDLPVAVYWRLADIYPNLVTYDMDGVGWINTGSVIDSFVRAISPTDSTARAVNSFQQNAMESHSHDFLYGVRYTSGSGGFGGSYWGTPIGIRGTNGINLDKIDSDIIDTTGDADENRPDNIGRYAAISI